MIDIGFTVTARGNDIQFERFAGVTDNLARFISWQRAAHLAIVVIGDFCHRQEHLDWLCRRSRSTGAIAPSNDAALAVALYESGGLERLFELEGDFALVGHDASTRRIFALRDPLGAYPLYWNTSKNQTAIGTSIRALFGDTPEVELDDEYVASYLAAPVDSVSELTIERTPFRRVTRLRPGWAMVLDLPTGHVTQRRYWQWEQRIVPLPSITIDEAGGALRGALSAAVRERLSARKGTASHFSGGMDSTGVALLAEDLLATRGKHICALTLQFETSAFLRQEIEFLDAALEARPSVFHERIAASSFLELDDCDRLPLCDEPSPKVVDFAVSALLVERAARSGCDTMLTGHGSDQLFFRTPSFVVAQLIRRGSVAEAFSVARASATDWGSNPKTIVQKALQQALPAGLRSTLGPLLGAGRARSTGLVHLQTPLWLRAEYARRYAIAERTRSLKPPRYDTRVFSAPDIPFVAGDWYHWHVAVPKGIAQRRPYFDARVIALALGVPLRLHLGPGSMKPLLATALTGTLPEKILRRAQKIHFDERQQGFGRHRLHLERLIAEAQIGDDIIDRASLTDAVAKAALGIQGGGSIWRLRMVLSFLLWLAQRASWDEQRIPRRERLG